jgi:Uma2 family endonuclease
MHTITPYRHKVNTQEWHKMSAVFHSAQHLELINGDITHMSPTGHQHSGQLNLLVHLFRQKLAIETVLSIQNPLTLSHYSEPEPDLMLLKADTQFYKRQHPRAQDVLLLIEISDHSLLFDQQQKLKLYAQHLIPDYWIINLEEQCIEVYRTPDNDDYHQQQIVFSGDRLQPLNFPNITLEISDIF